MLYQSTLKNRRNDFRDWLNPLRGMDMRKAVALMEAARRGDTTEYQWTIDLIEQLDPVLRAAKHSLIDGVLEMDWDIKMKPDKLLGASEKTMAKRQADTLRTEYERIENLEEVEEHLAMAEFRGYSHGELWRKSKAGPIFYVNCVPQWHMHRQSSSTEWLFDEQAALGSQSGVPLTPDWIVREVKDPIGPIALVAYVDKGLAKKDWNGDSAEYGIPPRWATLPADIAEADVAKWMSMMEAAVSGSFGVLPAGSEMTVGSVGSGSGGTSPFRERLDYENENLTLAVLSSMLTMLAKSGSGTLAGNAHADSLQRVTRSLAKKVSVCMQRKIDRDILGRLHPGEPILAWWSISYEQEASGDEFLATAKQANDLGYQTDPDQVEERTGLRLLDSPALPLSKGFAKTREQTLTDAVAQ